MLDDCNKTKTYTVYIISTLSEDINNFIFAFFPTFFLFSVPQYDDYVPSGFHCSLLAFNLEPKIKRLIYFTFAIYVFKIITEFNSLTIKANGFLVEFFSKPIHCTHTFPFNWGHI